MCAGETLRARAVIVAAGSTLRSLGVPGEDKFLGRGVSHCASCDGHFFAGQEVCVVGGGDSALDEALVLTEHAARVVVDPPRGGSLTPSGCWWIAHAANGKIEVVLGAVVEEILGDDAVSAVRLRDPRLVRRRSVRSRASSSMSGSSPTPPSCAAWSRSIPPATSRPTS